MFLDQGTIFARKNTSGLYSFFGIPEFMNYDFDSTTLYYVFSPTECPFVIAGGVRVSSDEIKRDTSLPMRQGLVELKLYVADKTSTFDVSRLSVILNHYFAKIRVGLRIQFVDHKDHADYEILWLDDPDVLALVEDNSNVNGKVHDDSILIYKPKGNNQGMFYTVLAHELLHVLNFGHSRKDTNIMFPDYIDRSIFITPKQLLNSNNIKSDGLFGPPHFDINFPNSDLLLSGNSTISES